MMAKRIAVLAVALAFVMSGTASAGAIAPQSRQSANAATALTLATFAMPGDATIEMNWGHRLKRNRWIFTYTVQGAIDCSAKAIVTVRRWYFPADLFGCPAGWNPSETTTEGVN